MIDIKRVDDDMKVMEATKMYKELLTREVKDTVNVVMTLADSGLLDYLEPKEKKDLAIMLYEVAMAPWTEQDE